MAGNATAFPSSAVEAYMFDGSSSRGGKDADLFVAGSSIVGGIALLSYSMSKMSRALRDAFGSSLKEGIKTACSNRLLGFATGTIATAALTSSTATSLLTVQFVQSGDMSFAQSLGVSLGINVGSTVNAHLMAYQLHTYALTLVGFGYLLSILCRSRRAQHVGESILGLGLLFLSFTCMSEGIRPLQRYKPFLALLAHMHSPSLAILTSGVCAVAFQSSNTVIAIAMMLGHQGFLTLEVATYFVLGSNIGTCFTSVFAAVGKRRDAMRVAVAYLLFKVVGVMLVLPFLPQFIALVEFSTAHARERAEALATIEAILAGAFADNALVAVETIHEQGRRNVLPAQIANSHTFLNLFIAAVFLPCLDGVARVVVALLPFSKRESEETEQPHAGTVGVHPLTPPAGVQLAASDGGSRAHSLPHTHVHASHRSPTVAWGLTSAAGAQGSQVPRVVDAAVQRVGEMGCEEEEEANHPFLPCREGDGAFNAGATRGLLAATRRR